MDRYDPTTGFLRQPPACRQDVHQVIRDWRYLATHKMAADDHYERLIAEAAQSRLLTANGVGSGWWPLLSATRRRVGETLVAVGTRLQDVNPSARTAAATAQSRA